MKTESNNSTKNKGVANNDLLALFEVFDNVNRRLDEKAIVKIPTRKDAEKEQNDATANK